MDTGINVEQVIGEIKGHMPEVYKSIQAQAELRGREAYSLVRRGIAGQPGCFYAFERGRVVGTPFDDPAVMSEVATTMVRFGCSSVVIWPPLPADPAKGAH